jgi:chemotaxis protein MotB
MALARLGGSRRPENYTWPGFVDALATLLMVIIFVLLVFVLIQVNLAYRVSGQDATMNDMRAQIASLGDMLNIERKQNTDLAADLERITSQLSAATYERDNLAAQLADATAQMSISTAELNRLSLLQSESNAALAEAEAALASRTLALEESENSLTEATARTIEDGTRIVELEGKNAAARDQVAQLTNAMTALRFRLEELTALLADKEAQAARDKIAIASLGQSLNNALATHVQELTRFRSEFFGRLREILSGRDDVLIVGDRFVFQSEVLFAQGQADIAPEGQEQLTKLAVVLNKIANDIPDDINWVLQVEGHTDDIPVRAGRFTDNWDLSTERALSVVRFLAEQGLASNRLAAAGYGEFQPLDTDDNDAARRRNRRIEMKLTQRVSSKD